MTTTPEQIAAASKANLEALLELSQKSFEGVEKLVELNLSTARAALGESAEAAKSLLTVKDPQELLALHTSLVQPAAEKAAAYGRQVYEIASSTQSEIAKLAEAQFGSAQSKLISLVEASLKNAPAGSESAVALVKSAMSAGNNALDSFQKATKQAVGVAEANFEALSQSATTAVAKVAPKARRAA